jgi:murein DD-endopeptidase MepM/ murein hydrolase activator NlpD
MKNLLDGWRTRYRYYKTVPLLNKIRISLCCILITVAVFTVTSAEADNIRATEIVTLNAVDESSWKIFIPIEIQPVENVKLYDPPHDYKDYIPRLHGNVSSVYGVRRNPITGKRVRHTGIDVSAKIGDYIYAPAKGIVTFVGWKSGYGKTVCIDHLNGYTTLFAHNHRNIARVGQEVSNKTVIALAGRTGQTTGPHIHIEVRHNGKLVDPMNFFQN